MDTLSSGAKLPEYIRLKNIAVILYGFISSAT